MNDRINEVLYHFEHRLLPDLVYRAEQDYKPVLIEHPEVLYTMFDKMCKDKEIENTYKESDFSTQAFRFDDEWLCIVIDFPAPDRPPLGVQAYMIFDKEGKRCGYYILELGKNEKDEICGYICAWDENGNHGSYGARKLEDIQKIFEEVYTIHVRDIQPDVVINYNGDAEE